MPSPSVLQQLGYKGTSLYLPEPFIIVYYGQASTLNRGMGNPNMTPQIRGSTPEPATQHQVEDTRACFL